jgi:hypothetical protein
MFKKITQRLYDCAVHPLIDQLLKSNDLAFKDFEEMYTSGLKEIVCKCEKDDLTVLYNEYFCLVNIVGQLIRLPQNNRNDVLNFIESHKKVNRIIRRHYKSFPLSSLDSSNAADITQVLIDSYKYLEIDPQRYDLKLMYYPSPLIEKKSLPGSI